MDALAEPAPGVRVREGPAGDGIASTPAGASIGGRVLVLNATYEPIHVCTVRRAAVLVLKSKAELIEHGRLPVRSERSAARPPGRHPPRHLRPGAARRPPPQDHPQGRPRPRRLDLPVLRLGAERPDGRPRDPAQPRRHLGLGEHRRLLRALQPPQGKPPPARDRDAPPQRPEGPGPKRLHPSSGPKSPPVVGALPGNGGLDTSEEVSLAERKGRPGGGLSQVRY